MKGGNRNMGKGNGKNNNGAVVVRPICAVCHRMMGSGQQDFILLPNGEKAEVSCLVNKIWADIGKPAQEQIPEAGIRPEKLDSPQGFFQSVTAKIMPIKTPQALALINKASALSRTYGLSL